MSAENRPPADQLAALGPGDTVTIETSGDFRRPWRTAGTVVRIQGPPLGVTTRSPRGARSVECFGRRDGVKVGGGRRAELVSADPGDPGTVEQRHRTQHIDRLYRAWTRNRDDLEVLRELHAAIAEHLAAAP